MNSGTRRAGVSVGILALLLSSPLTLAQEEHGNYASDLEAFIFEIDNTYPFFDLKGNREHWTACAGRLREEVKACASDEAFLGLIVEAFRALHDGHMWFAGTRVPPPPMPKRYFPGICFMPASEGRVVVMAGEGECAEALKPGTIITKIDGAPARKYLDEQAESAWLDNFAPSPQRWRMMVYRMPLQGEVGAKHRLAYLADGGEKEIEVSCGAEAQGWPHTYNLPAGLQRVGRSFFYTLLPSGIGYIYMRRVDDSAVPGLDAAWGGLGAAPAWIVDLRGNGGGGYDEALIERIDAYPKPLAVIIDEGCMSAGETLARDFARYADARLFGQRTAGASSSKRTWKFPSGIASVTMPTRSRWRADGQPIEFNGIEPDEYIEPDPADVAAGRNTEILRAEAWLLERIK